jgi:hypothetical protein
VQGLDGGKRRGDPVLADNMEPDTILPLKLCTQKYDRKY